MGKNNLVRQMGNARFLIVRSSSTFEDYRLACKLLAMGEDCAFKEKYTRVEVNERGTKRWFLGDKLHRKDGPAIKWADGGKEWWVEGKRHREDGPAVELADGSKYWFFDGKRHRIDGPAVEYWNGDEEWWVEGKCHRVDGPAVEFFMALEWWVDGKRVK